MKGTELRALAGASLGDRLDALRQILADFDRQKPRGLARPAAEKAVAQISRAFGCATLREDTDEGAWYVVIDFYRCPGCQAEFDEKDEGAVDGDGVISCPTCRTIVSGSEEKTRGETDAPAVG